MVIKTNYMLLITSITVSLSLFAMDEPHDPYKEIEMRHVTRFNEYITQRASLSDPYTQIEKYHNKLVNIQLSLRKQEQEMLADIQKKYCLNINIWEGYMRMIDKLKDINKTNKTKPLANAVQDKNLPYVFRRMLSYEAHKNDVNLKRITIQHDQNAARFLLTGEPCIAHCFVKHESDKKSIVIQETTIFPGKIVLNTDLFKEKSFTVKRVACIYLIEPIVQEFSLMYKTIEMFGQLHSCSDILESEACKKLIRFHMQLCTLLPSLRSKKTAVVMKEFHEDVRATNLLEVAQYDRLCMIKRYWDIITWLKTYACKKELLL